MMQILDTDNGILIPHSIYQEMREWEQTILDAGNEAISKCKLLEDENEELRKKLLELNEELLHLTLKAERLEEENKKLRRLKNNLTKRKMEDFFHKEGQLL